MMRVAILKAIGLSRPARRADKHDHAECRAIAQAGGRGFLRRDEEADDEVDVVGGCRCFACVQARRAGHQGEGEQSRACVVKHVLLQNQAGAEVTRLILLETPYVVSYGL
jgi:hypothetical protein